MCSCGINVEKEYNKIVQDTSDALNLVQDSMQVSTSYTLTKNIGEIETNYDSKLSELKTKLADNEKKLAQLNQVEKSIDSLAAYQEVISSLESKNNEILDSIKNKFWIVTNIEDEESFADPSLLIKINDEAIVLPNYKKTYKYSLKDGIIYLDKESIPLFFEVNDSSLTLRNNDGDIQEYKIATAKESIIGKWGWKEGSWVINLLNKGGDEAFFNGSSFYGGTYSISNNNVSVKFLYDFTWDRDRVSDWYTMYGKYNPQKDTIYFSIGQSFLNKETINTTYFRIKQSGPKSPTILFGYVEKE